MLLPQSLLMSLLASYKKQAFGQGAAHHHGRPLRVGTRRAGAVGGVADARAAPVAVAACTSAQLRLTHVTWDFLASPAPAIGSLGSGGGASNHLQGHFQL